jgi:hypothetical protein
MRRSAYSRARFKEQRRVVKAMNQVLRQWRRPRGDATRAIPNPRRGFRSTFSFSTASKRPTNNKTDKSSAKDFQKISMLFKRRHRFLFVFI